MLGIGIVASWLVNEVLGWHAVPLLGLVAALALIATLVLILRGTHDASRRRVLAFAVVGLLGFELFSFQSHDRLRRFDIESPAPAYVAFLREHIAGGRILDGGGAVQQC